MFFCYLIASHIILCPIVCEDTGHFPRLMYKVGVYSCLQIRETKFRDLTCLLRYLLHTALLNSQLSNFFSLFYFDFFLPTICTNDLSVKDVILMIFLPHTLNRCCVRCKCAHPCVSIWSVLPGKQEETSSKTLQSFWELRIAQTFVGLFFKEEEQSR